MLTVVCWKWRGPSEYRSQFTAENVNILYGMVRRNLHVPHEFVCVTDDPEGIDPGIRIVPLWDDFKDVPSPHGGRNPSCYRRLKAFSKEAKDILGERILSIDLDTVITGDITPLARRDEDFVIWGDTNPATHYNGGLWLLRAGTRTEVWERFDPRTSPQEAKRAGKHGSDQGWISHVLGGGEARYSKADGVYSYRCHIKPTNARALPSDARMVQFHGAVDPWDREAQQLDWVRRHYRKNVNVRALVLGGAENVFDDLEQARALFEPDIVVAINHIGTIWPHRLDHWVSHHADQLTRWVEQRRENGLPGAGQLWTGPNKPNSKHIRDDIRQHEQKGGSSGLLAACIALDHADRVVLAGVPMDPGMPHWHGKQDGKPWKEGAQYLDHWRQKLPEIEDRVTSFSGFTRELLGAPSREWLESGRNTEGVEP